MYGNQMGGGSCNDCGSVGCGFCGSDGRSGGLAVVASESVKFTQALEREQELLEVV